MIDYLKVLGATRVNKYVGGFAAVRKLMSSQRVPLCSMHFAEMEGGGT